MNLTKNIVKKVCGFYVSDWHLATMILPYINKEIKRGVFFATILQNGISPNIEELILRMGLSDETKNEIKEINWTNTNMQKYADFKEYLDNIVEEDKEISIIINGSNEYIEMANSNIDNWLNKNEQYLSSKNVKINIINCFDVTKNNNINHILGNHQYLLNTAGERKIETVFCDFG